MKEISAKHMLRTDRLLLRQFNLADASLAQRYAGDVRIAEMTENIPHPYEDGMAEEWIVSSHAKWSQGTQFAFAACGNDDGALIGCCGLVVNRKHRRAELGYWVGVDFWGKGYCTEAATAVVEFGFRQLGLNRIEATHLTMNPASGAVMKKIGMTHEATFNGYVLKDGEFVSMEQYVVLA